METSVDTRLSNPSTDNQRLGTLGHLPIELRNDIYCMLLAPSYTKYQTRRRGRYEGNEDNTKSKGSRNFLYPRLVSRYDYELNILRASSQTYQEASYILSGTNLFIEVKTVDPNLSACCQDAGLAVLFNNSMSSNLTKCAMQIEMAHAPAMDPATSSIHSDLSVVMNGRPQFSFIITCNDLPVFCRLLLALDDPTNKLNFILETQLTLTFSTNVSGLAEKGYRGRDRLLNPFRTMCGFGSANIQDVEGEPCADDLAQRLISKGAPVHEILQHLWSWWPFLTSGADFDSRGYPQLLLEYLAALDRLSSGMGGHHLSALPEDNMILVGGWRSLSIFEGLETIRQWALCSIYTVMSRLNRCEEVFEYLDLWQDNKYTFPLELYQRRASACKMVGDLDNELIARQAMLDLEPDNARFQGRVSRLKAEQDSHLHHDC